jgi:hypothetical protein
MPNSMDFLFKTYFLIIWGLLWGLFYIIVYFIYRQKDKINIIDFSTIGLNSISLIIGFKLIYLTFVASFQEFTDLKIEDIYTAYGGALIMWVSTKNVIKKYPA